MSFAPYVLYGVKEIDLLSLASFLRTRRTVGREATLPDGQCGTEGGMADSVGAEGGITDSGVQKAE